MSSKLAALAIIMPATLLGGLYILRNPRARSWWVWGNVAYGFIVFTLTQIDPAINATGQLATAGGNPIGSARATGAALTVFGTYFLFGRHRYLTFVGVAFMAFATVSAAERGPALAAIVAIMITAALAPARGKLFRFSLIGSALAALGWWLIKGGFIGTKLTETGDVSSISRLRLWSATWQMMLHHPFGIGWGGLFDALPPNEHLASGYVQYPHNILFEAGSEAGILAALALVAIVCVAFRLQRKVSHSAAESSMLALLIFFIVNALVSSDITGNRGFWVSVGAGLAAHFVPDATKATSNHAAPIELSTVSKSAHP